MLYVVINFFDKMYFKNPLIFPSSSKNIRNFLKHLILYDRIASNHYEKSGQPASVWQWGTVGVAALLNGMDFHGIGISTVMQSFFVVPAVHKNFYFCKHINIWVFQFRTKLYLFRQDIPLLPHSLIWYDVMALGGEK